MMLANDVLNGYSHLNTVIEILSFSLSFSTYFSCRSYFFFFSHLLNSFVVDNKNIKLLLYFRYFNRRTYFYRKQGGLMYKPSLSRPMTSVFVRRYILDQIVHELSFGLLYFVFFSLRFHYCSYH